MTVRRWAGRDELPEVREWPVAGRRPIYESQWVSLDLVAVEPPGAPSYEHHVVEVPYDAVGVVAHHAEFGVLLLYRHRFITGTSGFEVPAGGADSGEAAVEAARRELVEETGWELSEGRLMLSANVSDGFTSQRFHFVYGRVERQVADPIDAYESTALYWVPVTELAELISTGLVPGSPSMLALLYAERFGYFDDIPS